MKKILLLLLIVSITLPMYSYAYTVTESEKDTTDINFRKKKIKIVKEEGETKIYVKKKGSDVWEETDEYDDEILDDEDVEWNYEDDGSSLGWGWFEGNWAGFEIGLNNYVDSDYSLSRDASNEFMDVHTGKSWNVNLNLMQYSLNLFRERVGIVTGLGFEFNDYKFDNDITIQKVNGVIVEDAVSYQDVNIDKTKLSTVYLTAPLLLEFQIPLRRNDGFVFSGGVIGGMKIGSHTKVVYKEDGNKRKDKERDDFNLSPFRYGATARIGFNGVKLYGTYYFTTMFEENKGPELYPIAVGISLSLN